MISGFDQFYRRPLPGDYQQRSAADYEMSFEDFGIDNGKIANFAIGNAAIQNGAITNSKIVGLNANKINADTLSAISSLLGIVNVGGSGNGNGILRVKDASDNEKVILNNTGITVKDGKITVKSNTDSTIIDGSGIVGTNNFEVAQAGSTNSSSTTTTSTSLVDIPNTSLNFSIVRSRLLLVIFTAEFLFISGDDGMEAYIYVGGDVNDVQEPRISLKGSVHRATGTDHYITLTTYLFRTISANSPPTSYTLKARWKVNTGGVEAYCRNRQLSYYLLGK